MVVDVQERTNIGIADLPDFEVRDTHGMSFGNTLATAWEGIALNKLRSFLTTLGIIIGVAAVIVMLAVSAGAEAEIADQISGLGANLIMVTPVRSVGGVGRGPGGPGGGGGARAGFVPFTYDEALAIQSNVDGLAGVTVEQSTTQDVRAAGTTLTGISIIGVTEDYLAVRDYKIGSGRFFNASENDGAKRVAIIGAGIATDLFGATNALGQQLRIGSTRFSIIGIMAEQGVVGNTDNDGRIYIPASVVFKRFAGRGLGGNRVRMIFTKAESPDMMDTVMDRITIFLSGYRGIDPAEPNFGVQTQNDIVDARASTTEAFRNLLAWVAGISLVVGGIGIMNIMLVSVTERTREIGLRQALGARPSDVRRQFLIEAVVLSLVGGLVGVVAGVVGSYLFGQYGGMRTEIVPMSLPLAFVAATAVGIFFGYYPASQAAQLDPIEALRRE